MSGVNKHTIIGNLGKDPEFRTFEGGAQNCSFSIATSETWKDKTTGEKKERTEWHNVVVWGKLAEIAAKYLKKGSKVYVCGPSRTRTWEKDGITRYVVEVYADELTMLDRKPEGSGRAPAPTENYGASTGGAARGGSDDLPF